MSGASYQITPYSFETTEHYVSLHAGDQHLTFFTGQIESRKININMQGHHVVFLGPIVGEEIKIRCTTMVVLNTIRATTDMDIFTDGYLINFGNIHADRDNKVNSAERDIINIALPKEAFQEMHREFHKALSNQDAKNLLQTFVKMVKGAFGSLPAIEEHPSLPLLQLTSQDDDPKSSAEPLHMVLRA